MTGAILFGFVVGIALWLAFVRPVLLDNHERQRRAAGLPARRDLPEDRA